MRLSDVERAVMDAIKATCPDIECRPLVRFGATRAEVVVELPEGVAERMAAAGMPLALVIASALPNG